MYPIRVGKDKDRPVVFKDMVVLYLLRVPIILITTLPTLVLRVG